MTSTDRVYYTAQLRQLQEKRLVLRTELTALRGRRWWWRLANYGRIRDVRTQHHELNQQCASLNRLLVDNRIFNQP